MAPQRLDEQEAQRGDILADRGRTELFSLKQVRLVLSDLLRSELVRRLMKMLGEVADDPDVGFCGTMRVITTLEFLQHFLTKLGHRTSLFCDPTYLNSLALAPSGLLDARTRESVCRDSGFVQIAISLIFRLLTSASDAKRIERNRNLSASAC